MQPRDATAQQRLFWVGSRSESAQITDYRYVERRPRSALLERVNLLLDILGLRHQRAT